MDTSYHEINDADEAMLIIPPQRSHANSDGNYLSFYQQTPMFDCVLPCSLFHKLDLRPKQLLGFEVEPRIAAIASLLTTS